ncbi:hypothetical protein OJ997_15465 [Solirubrobacter phytolaccae]|uniref:Glutaredoxin domain-containing protein n=1 Tax=Solirubrobacter phytolaccae TaxID=1404360 RepID=A0A9X3NAV1_9ACTN|nr:glutaredoxin domain-containing protein [Solirubrobacter phytolaccae]MDA0181704.1 hypothetical protein [Solirubrobacter phytolaccae]
MRATVATASAVLFMAGTPQDPRSPASYRAVAALRLAEIDFLAIDVDADLATQRALVAVSGSSTTTQFFAAGEFIGGCEVLIEMYRTGELQRLRDASAGRHATPALSG